MDMLPIWAFFLVTIVLVLGTLALGYYAGNRRSKVHPGTPEGPIGAVIGSVLGLLAFMLAFTFSVAAERYSARKQLLLDEVNAIGTAALRAELLPEPHRTACHDLLKRYVDGRVQASTHVEDLTRILGEAEDLHDQLWAHARALARTDMNSDIGALFVEALNELIDLHTSRVTVVLLYHIPQAVWAALLFLLALGMLGVGYQFGITGRHNVLVFVLMTCSFALVLVLIASLDSRSGSVQVDQRPMLELQQKLSRPVTGSTGP